MPIRIATPDDLVAFDATLAAAAHAPHPEATRLLLSGRPNVVPFVAEEVGRVVGTGVAIVNGDAQGTLALVAVAPAHRGRGVGRALAQWGADALRARGCETIVVSATPETEGFFERLGWRNVGRDALYAGYGLEAAPRALAARFHAAGENDREAIGALDRAEPAAPRGGFVAALGGAYVATDDDGRPRGYLVPLPWGGGPAVADDAEAGREILDFARALHGPGPLTLRVPGENHAAREHLERAGFREAGVATRMALGDAPDAAPERVWAEWDPAVG